MSSDLLKEFEGLEVNPWRADGSQSSANKDSVDGDDFGDFENPGNENVTHTQSSSPPSNAIRYSWGSERSRVHPFSTDAGYIQPYIHSSTTEVQDAPSNDDDWAEFSQQSVIFDADLEVARQQKEVERTLAEQRRSKESANILLHPITSTKAYTPPSPSPAIVGSNNDHGSVELTKARLQSSRDISKRRIETTKPTTLEEPTIVDEQWDDFEAAATSGPEPSSAPPSRTLKVAEASNNGPPPSNIPPPSILLPVIATIFGSLITDLKTAQFRHPLDQASTLTQLGALLSTIRAGARILAGRKLRWKRDSLLSQSMKIGPAHSGKAGGMKLAGVDKAESRREDQEAAEALQVWKQQAGPLRTAVVALNAPLPEHERFKVPEITDNMPIRQGKPSEGMVTAPKCCFLCGIKRDERAAKIDVDVEDSFGEWWVEHWGHVDCVGFWEKHKDFLRQR